MDKSSARSIADDLEEVLCDAYGTTKAFLDENYINMSGDELRKAITKIARHVTEELKRFAQPDEKEAAGG